MAKLTPIFETWRMMGKGRFDIGDDEFIDIFHFVNEYQNRGDIRISGTRLIGKDGKEKQDYSKVVFSATIFVESDEGHDVYEIKVLVTRKGYFSIWGAPNRELAKSMLERIGAIIAPYVRKAGR